MPNRATLLKEKETHVKAARDIAAKAEAEGRDFTDEERTSVKAAIDAAKKAHDQILEVDGDAALIDQLNALGQPIGDLAKGGGSRPAEGKSLGERFTEAPEFKAWLAEVAPSGVIPDRLKGLHAPPVAFKGVKDILSGGDTTSAGALVDRQWLGLLDALGTFQRPLVLRDLITSGQTGSDAVEYARITGYTNAAAPVAEATGPVSGTGANVAASTKPQSALTLEKVVANVKTIAHWLPATKRALSDAGQLRTLIDNWLRYGLEEELEDQMVNGDGTGENLEGILNVSGIQAQAWDTNLLVTTRKARTKVRTVGRAVATAYLLNPEDNERIDLMRDDSGGAGTGQFLFGSPAGMQVQTLWGLPRVESEAIPAGTGLVGDFRRAVLWDREQAAISVSDSHDDFFVRNLVAILAEMRAAFGVVSAPAFVEIDLTA